MPSIAELLAKHPIEQKKQTARSERAFVLKQMYAIYSSPQERILRKKENWRRYVAWLKKAKTPHSDEQVAKFRKCVEFVKEVPEDRFWYFVCHVKTKDLYAALSIMQDKKNRGESASAYIISLSKSPQKNILDFSTYSLCKLK